MFHSDTPAQPPQPNILVILTACDPEQLALLEFLHTHLHDQYILTAATDTGSEENLLPVPCIGKGSTEYMRKLRMADVLIILQPGARITRYDPQQLCIAVTDYAHYCANGLQIKGIAPSEAVAQSRDWTGHAFGYVYNAPVEKTYVVNPLLATFSRADTPAPFAQQIVTRIQHWMGETPQPRTRVFYFLAPITELSHLPEDVAAFLHAAQEARDLQLCIITPASSSDLLRAGFAFGQVMSPDQFKTLFSPDVIKPDNIVIYNDFSQLVKAGIQSHLPIFIYGENLRLLSARKKLSVAVLRELAADPGEFHKASLATLYDTLDVATQRVSIIVPHYNTDADKLERCLRSALECRLYHDNVEVILVDDGSKEDIRPELKARLGQKAWTTVRHFRKKNEGVGLARNYGIRKSTGDFVFFLDSDDEIVSENLVRMLAHAVYTGAAVVKGKRVLYDEDGNLITDSLDYVFRAVSRQVNRQHVNIYDDIMVTNMLLQKEKLAEGDLWFTPGYYEDNLFASRVYAHFDHIECLNLRIHKWYQYKQDGSITKTNSSLHIDDKLTSLSESWPYLSDEARKVRIKFNLNHELPIFLEMAMQGTQLEHVRAFDRARTYVHERMGYVDKSTLSEQGLALLSAFERGAVFPERQPPQDLPVPTPPRWVFFPRTHFQVLEAIAFVLYYQVPSVLVVAKGIPGFHQPFIDKLRETGIFPEIVEYKNNAVYASLNCKLRLGRTGATKIFDTLYRSFDASLPTLRETDIGVFFLEGWPERYYIGRKFHRIVKMEDGYCSTTREFKLCLEDGIWCANRDLNSVWGGINIFIQQEYDRLHKARIPVSEIYVSAPVDPVLLTHDYAETEITHINFKDMIAKHRAEFLGAMETLYGSVPALEPEATIILTQPLFFDYCTHEENLALVAHLISLASHEKVYLKPHPMDPADYSVLDVTLLPARVPFEYLEATGSTIAEAITFGSGALVNSELVKTTRSLFPFEGFVHTDVVAGIERICYDLGAMELPDAQRLIARHNAPVPRPTPGKPASPGGATAGPPPHASKGAGPVRRKIGTALRLLRSDRREFVKQLRSTLGLA